MFNRFKPKTDFSRNVLMLMTGTVIAQAIPIAIMPILTRIYKPEDFGLLALFTSITAILSSVANGRYELAIMLPEKNEDAINIAAVGLLIAVGFSILILITVILFNSYIVGVLGNKDIKFWLYFVPFVVFMTGLFNVLNYLNTRLKLYKDIAKANVYKSVGASSVNLIIGSIKSGATGLISGVIFAQIISNYRLAQNSKRNYNLKSINKFQMKKLAVRYSDFPKFSMWAILANTLSYNLINILISLYYSVATLGFYSFAQKMLGVPSSLIGNSIGQVYFQEANREKQKTGKAVKTFNKTSKKLAIISIFIFTPLYFILPFLFEFVFGVEWRLAGEYAQIVLPLVAIQFIVAAVTTTNSIFQRQIISLLWQIGLLVIAMSSIFISYFLNFEFKLFLNIFSLSITIHYILLWIILKRVASGMPY